MMCINIVTKTLLVPFTWSQTAKRHWKRKWKVKGNKRNYNTEALIHLQFGKTLEKQNKRTKEKLKRKKIPFPYNGLNLKLPDLISQLLKQWASKDVLSTSSYCLNFKLIIKVYVGHKSRRWLKYNDSLSIGKWNYFYSFWKFTDHNSQMSFIFIEK